MNKEGKQSRGHDAGLIIALLLKWASVKTQRTSLTLFPKDNDTLNVPH